MPRYYFDTISAGHLCRDDFGADLEDDDEARDQAVALLPYMARDELPDGDQHEIVARVRNERAEIIYEACLTLDGRWWPGPR